MVDETSKFLPTQGIPFLGFKILSGDTQWYVGQLYGIIFVTCLPGAHGGELQCLIRPTRRL
jgi:hypothetical protein